MFLKELNAEEKLAFLSLSIHATVADGKLPEEEQEVLAAYFAEMGLEAYREEDILPPEDAIAVFQSSTNVIKRIVLLELLSLLYADGNYDIAEQEIVRQYRTVLQIPEQEAQRCDAAVRKYTDCMMEITDYILGI